MAVHADQAVPYGKIVEVLDAGSRVGLKVVLATKPTQASIDRQAAQEEAQQPAPVQGLPQ